MLLEKYARKSSEKVYEERAISAEVQAFAREIKGNGLLGAKTVIGLANHQFIVRYVTVPTVPDQYLRSLIQNELGHSIHLPFEDALFDAVAVPPLTEIDPKMTTVCLIAAPREYVDQSVELAKQAQLQPVAVDIPPLALYRFASLGYEKACFYTLIHVEMSEMSISIFRQGFLYFYRNLELMWDERYDSSSEQFASMLVSEIERMINFFLMSFSGISLQKNVYLLYSQFTMHEFLRNSLTNDGVSEFVDLRDLPYTLSPKDQTQKWKVSASDWRQIVARTPVSEFVSLGLACKEVAR